MNTNTQTYIMKSLILITGLVALGLALVLTGDLRSLMSAVATFCGALFLRAYLVPARVRK